ncbi:MAG: hypothetical protein WCF18_11805, partial [Chthoniobacteraceae bacterium]
HSGSRECSSLRIQRPRSEPRRYPSPSLFFRATLLLGLLAAPCSLLAQRLTTVGETEFRSRWANYQVDRPRQEVALELTPEAAQAQSGFSLRSFLQEGPVVVRASASTGWEYSDQVLQTPTAARNTSKSSLFTAPAIALLYDREIGAWSASARYSAGYLYYLDQNFVAAGDGGGTFSQTAGIDVTRKGSRFIVRSAAVGSYGTGYEIERAQQTKRLTLGETLSADYQLTEFARVGALASADYVQYAGEIAGNDDVQTRFSGKLFGDYFWTGRTGFHLELGSGIESQDTGRETAAALDRSYYQGLLGVNYQLTPKLMLRAGLGYGIVDESEARAGAQGAGSRAIYTLDAEYAPTEKISARLHFGLEGTSVDPDFSLALNWHPREPLFVNLSVYQTTGLSTINFVEDQTRRGFLFSVRQRFFQRLDTAISAGLEQQERRNSSVNQSTQTHKPYTYIAATLAWEINTWLAWQVQYSRSEGRDFALGAGDRPQNRASLSLRLTF